MQIKKDLTKESPRSPRVKLGGYVIAARTLDKCLALLNGNVGEYHYDCPLDKRFFTFKGITGDQFKSAVQAAKSEAELVAWLEKNGTPRTSAEIEKWSTETAADSLARSPDAGTREYFANACSALGLDSTKVSTFDWLEVDDKVTCSKAGSACQI